MGKPTTVNESLRGTFCSSAFKKSPVSGETGDLVNIG